MKKIIKKIIITTIILILIFNTLFNNIQSQTLHVTKNNLIKEIKISENRTGRNYPEILWWYDLNAPCFGSAATDDIDTDNNLELVFGTYFNDEHVYALNANNGSLLWN